MNKVKRGRYYYIRKEIRGKDLARFKSYNTKQTFMTVVDPDIILKENGLLRVIEEFIEEHVSLEKFEMRYNNEDTGAPGVHPKLMLKLIFYSYANGVYSSRRIEDRIRYDTNFIYLTGNQKPDHSTICDFILRYKDEIKDIFSKLIYVLNKLGLMGLDFIAIDGTKIRANANKVFAGDINEFKKRREKIIKRIDKLLEETLTEDKESDERIKKLEKEKNKIDSFFNELELMESREREGYEERKNISLTDRDSRLVKDKESIYMGYNCQAAVDDKNHFIMSAKAFNNENDVELLKPMIDQTKKETGDDLTKTEIGLDAGYYSTDNVIYSSENKLDVYLPEGKGKGGKKGKNTEKIGVKDCKLELDGDIKRLICPGGQVMETTAVRDKKRYKCYQFNPKKKICKTCELYENCRNNSRKSFMVKKEYFDALPIHEKMTEKLSSEEGKKRLIDRSSTVEHVFGEIKEHYGFKRLFHRGLSKADLIWKMIAIAYNLRKLASLGSISLKVA